jgi:hypothetical protein
MFQLELGEYKAIIFVYGSTRNEPSFSSLQLFAVFTTDRDRADVMTDVNQWNIGRRFSCAYMDQDGDYAIKSDLDLEGGVSTAGIRVFIETYRGILDVFAKEGIGD